MIHPKTIESGLTPANFQMPFEDITLTSKDGIKISGWFIKSPSAGRPAVIMLHGYPAEKGDLLYTAYALYQDFNLLLIDFRSFGKSGGTHTTLGVKERFDLMAALDFLQSRGLTKAGVFGFSLGGAVAILTAAEDSRIAAVASYASYADLTTIGHDTYKHLSVLRYPLVWLIKFWGRLIWNVDANLSPRLAAERLRIPVMIIHTQKDEQVDFSHAEILQNALRRNPKAEFYFPAEGRHGELPADFEERIKKFFLKSL